MTSPDAFFALVECHVTPPMLDAGYTEIGEYDEVTDGREQGPLVAGGPRWFAPWRRVSGSFPLPSPRVGGSGGRVLQVGYEGYDEEGVDDERWVRYHPERRELDLTDWREELEGHADWDLWADRDVPTDEELERRVRLLGVAIASSQ